MNSEIRLAKVEVEVELLKDLVEKNAQAIASLRDTMERRFNEQQVQIAELRREASINFRWLLGINLSTFLFLIGLMGRVAGLY